jgi:hypothetical protein
MALRRKAGAVDVDGVERHGVGLGESPPGADKNRHRYRRRLGRTWAHRVRIGGELVANR